jgi:type IV secretion system protein VirB2
MKSFFLKIIIICLFLVCNVNSANAVEMSPDRVICNVVQTLSGPISQGIATLVIIITGYSFFVGKVSIGMLMVVAAGIMFVFGAQTIMGFILPGGTDCTAILQGTAPCPTGQTRNAQGNCV